MHLPKILRISALTVAVTLAGAPAPVAAQDQASSATVLDRHLQAFAKRDVDAIIADYSDDSVLITPQAVLKGKAEIRPFMEAIVKEFSSPQAVLTIHQRHAWGPIAYITWAAETPSNSYQYAADTFYVVNDRIRYQTFAAKLSAK